MRKDIQDVIDACVANGGSLAFNELTLSKEFIREAEGTGLLTWHITGGGWGFTEEFRLTSRGRERYGLPPVVTFWMRARIILEALLGSSQVSPGKPKIH